MTLFGVLYFKEQNKTAHLRRDTNGRIFVYKGCPKNLKFKI